MKNNIKIKYGRINENGESVVGRGHPKNTLVTIRDDDRVYFGIARCHLTLDNFKKDTGKHIALGRAELAMEEYKNSLLTSMSSNGTLELVDEKDTFVAHGFLRGVISAGRIEELLKYFKDIDKLTLNTLKALMQADNKVHFITKDNS